MALPNNYLDDMWKALEARINAVVTDKNITLYDSQTRRVNWRVMIENKDLPVPFVVVQAGSAVPTDQFGIANRTHFYPVDLFYVRDDAPTGTETAGNVRVEDSIEQILFDLMADFYPTDPTVHTNIQVVEEPLINVSGTNPANAVFVDASAPYIAGMVSFQFLCGAGR